jgi:GNAT superfamily N-acetyltransferase
MLIIRPLDPSHDRKAFDCGVPVLNDFLHKTARQHRDKGLSNTFVLLDENTPREILGFFTLSFLEVDATTLPGEYSHRLPKSSRLPAAKLARLVVDRRCQGKGYGDLLMADAVKRIVATINGSGGITGFFVDAKDEHAQRFYLRYGFIPLQDTPFTLFLPLQTLLKGLKKSSAD